MSNQRSTDAKVVEMRNFVNRMDRFLVIDGIEPSVVDPFLEKLEAASIAVRRDMDVEKMNAFCMAAGEKLHTLIDAVIYLPLRPPSDIASSVVIPEAAERRIREDTLARIRESAIRIVDRMMVNVESVTLYVENAVKDLLDGSHDAFDVEPYVESAGKTPVDSESKKVSGVDPRAFWLANIGKDLLEKYAHAPIERFIHASEPQSEEYFRATFDYLAQSTSKEEVRALWAFNAGSIYLASIIFPHRISRLGWYIASRCSFNSPKLGVFSSRIDPPLEMIADRVPIKRIPRKMFIPMFGFAIEPIGTELFVLPFLGTATWNRPTIDCPTRIPRHHVDEPNPAYIEDLRKSLKVVVQSSDSPYQPTDTERRPSALRLSTSEEQSREVSYPSPYQPTDTKLLASALRLSTIEADQMERAMHGDPMIEAMSGPATSEVPMEERVLDDPVKLFANYAWPRGRERSGAFRFLSILFEKMDIDPLFFPLVTPGEGHTTIRDPAHLEILLCMAFGKIPGFFPLSWNPTTVLSAYANTPFFEPVLYFYLAVLATRKVETSYLDLLPGTLVSNDDFALIRLARDYFSDGVYRTIHAGVEKGLNRHYIEGLS